MIRDKYLRILFILLQGIVIPFFSGIISYSRYSIPAFILINAYFILLSICIWSNQNHNYA
jgi:hypothetical protein